MTQLPRNIIHLQYHCCQIWFLGWSGILMTLADSVTCPYLRFVILLNFVLNATFLNISVYCCTRCTIQSGSLYIHWSMCMRIKAVSSYSFMFIIFILDSCGSLYKRFEVERHKFLRFH